MKLRILIVGLSLQSGMFGAAALAADSGAELFQKAVTQERAAGNLEEAIKLYQRVAKEFASDRALAAKALVQEAQCYEKLGQDKAVKIYEQVARDYRDQREPSATASARLTALRQGDRAVAPATMTQRKIDLPVPSDYTKTDGQRVLYKDVADGALMICDLAGRDKRVIFKPKAGDKVTRYVPSRDLSMVVFGLFGGDGSRKNAMIKADGTGYHELDQSILADLCMPDWSWDNRYLFMCGNQPDGKGQLLRISAADGEIRKVLTSDNVIVHRPSPDGRFFALGKSPARFGKVFAAPSQGGDSQLLSDSARILDWTRDGRYLAVASERSGSEALYLLPVKDGRLAGDPVFVRYGPSAWGSTNAAGALIYQSTLPAVYATWLGTLDSGGRAVDWRQLKLSGSGNGNSFAARWSPDSAQIAYSAPDDAAGRNTWFVHLRNIASGEEREVYRSNAGRAVCTWAAQQQSLFCEVFNQPDTAEVISIAIDSGRVQPLGSLTRGQSLDLLFAGSDDRALYFWREPGSELIRWEISAQQPTTLEAIPFSGALTVPKPDERWIARRYKATIEIRPRSGGDWKPLISLEPTQMLFTPDGNWLLYHDVDAAGKQSLFRVSTAGGQPERVGDFPGASKGGYLSISPDGQKVIAAISSAASSSNEVFLLENFEPKQLAAR